MNAITGRADLEAYTSKEPRLSDQVLAKHLGLTDPKHIRKIIDRHKAALEAHGELCTMVIEKQQGGRPGRVYWLNEAQALLVCTLSRTGEASAARRAVTEAYAEFCFNLQQYPGAPMSEADPAPMDAADLRASLAFSSGTGKAAIFDRHLIDLTDNRARPGERFLVVCARQFGKAQMMITEAEPVTLPAQWGGFSAWVRLTSYDKRHAIVLGRVVGRV